MMAVTTKLGLTTFLLVMILGLYGYASDPNRGLKAPETFKWVFLDELPPNKPPYFLTPTILERLFPELSNPTVPSLEDIGDNVDQWHFIAGGFAFVLFGDFNLDGLYDVAFVGKYDDLEISQPQFFFSIITVKGKSAKIQHFTKLQHKRALLKTFPKYYKNKYDAILRVYTFESCDGDHLFWNGSSYVAISDTE
jgi:hypothetical protein